jgi:hypothetical protein
MLLLGRMVVYLYLITLMIDDSEDVISGCSFMLFSLMVHCAFDYRILFYIYDLN